MRCPAGLVVAVRLALTLSLSQACPFASACPCPQIPAGGSPEGDTAQAPHSGAARERLFTQSDCSGAEQAQGADTSPRAMGSFVSAEHAKASRRGERRPSRPTLSPSPQRPEALDMSDIDLLALAGASDLMTMVFPSSVRNCKYCGIAPSRCAERDHSPWRCS